MPNRSSVGEKISNVTEGAISGAGIGFLILIATGLTFMAGVGTANLTEAVALKLDADPETARILSFATGVPTSLFVSWLLVKFFTPR